MKSQHSELFYYAMAVYGVAALAIVALPSATPVETLADVQQPAVNVTDKSGVTKFAGAPLVSGQAEF